MPISIPLISPFVRIIGDIFRAAEVAILKIAAQEIARTLNDDTHLARVEGVKRLFQQVLMSALRDGERALRDAQVKAHDIGAEAAIEDLIRDLGGSMDDYEDEGFNQAAIRRLSAEAISPLRSAVFSALRTADDAYREVILQTTPTTIVGGQSRRHQAQRALDAFADRGITGFTDKSGRRWELASYAEMATRTQLARTMVDSHLDKLRSLGKNLVIVSDHARECAICRPWEGQVLVIEGMTGHSRVEEYDSLHDRYVMVDVAGTVMEARLAGLFHPNCRHNLGLYIPGATPRPTATADPAGDRANQLMRQYERQIRKWKKRQAVAVSPSAAQTASARISAYQRRARALERASGVPRQSAREQIGKAR